jgi:hypothetical protein
VQGLGESMFSLPHLLTWGLALMGAGLSLAASLGKVLGCLGSSGANRLTLVAYVCLGLSIALFTIRGLWVPA